MIGMAFAITSAATCKGKGLRSVTSISTTAKKPAAIFPLDSPTRFDYLADCQCKIELDGDCSEIMTNFDTIKGRIHFYHKRRPSTGFILGFKSLRIQLEGIATSKCETYVDSLVTLSVEKQEDRFLPSDDAKESFLSSLCFYFIKGNQPAKPQFEFTEGSELRSFPFEILLTGQTLPATFENDNGKISYVLVVYGCLYGDLEYVAADKILTTKGCLNLSQDPMLNTPAVVSRETSKSFFSKRQTLKVGFLVDKRGYLPGESVRWQLQVKNPTCDNVGRICVSLVQKILYFANRTSKSTVNILQQEDILVNTNDGELFKEGAMIVPNNLIPSFIRTRAFKKSLEILYLMQFSIETSGQSEPLTGETLIVIGTTRDDTDHDGKGNLNEMAGPSSRLSTDWPQWDTISACSTLPPSYSNLSSRSTSHETLPPSYDDLTTEDYQGIGGDESVDADLDNIVFDL